MIFPGYTVSLSSLFPISQFYSFTVPLFPVSPFCCSPSSVPLFRSSALPLFSSSALPLFAFLSSTLRFSLFLSLLFCCSLLAIPSSPLLLFPLIYFPPYPLFLCSFPLHVLAIPVCSYINQCKIIYPCCPDASMQYSTQSKYLFFFWK